MWKRVFLKDGTRQRKVVSVLFAYNVAGTLDRQVPVAKAGKVSGLKVLKTRW